ncbi:MULTISPECIES: PTS transporter subunit IIC [Weissella]|uniref:Putative membrane protein, putative toxin regulator n=1 Tax=Weissella cibaria TaxID=137591 RepID=A0A0D1LI50_9LACO|nr:MULTISPECIES: PTS sugar transporter subunit IIC [Weissella]KIU20105.1 putative membrane protein, putative toxin regulator [Weissella cibaria]MBJ7641157.1 PTS sugar transporter subunit IIC [Weissella confusa]MBJ7643264.1 PTS sugar transporter subunit IIC [Weissella confusa]MBJ7655457.1 PTS sugar transporter subunit IIC [Weissella confusa]MCT0021952.1 PTS sugar transporter subunit IIC [Weissella cibaria]
MTSSMGQTEKKTAKEYVYLVSQGISNTILAVLGMGLLLNTLGTSLHWQALTEVGLLAQRLLAPALGMAIASMLETTTLVTGATMIASTVGANSIYFTSSALAHTTTATGWVAPQLAGAPVMTAGQPVSAVLAGLLAALLGKWLTGKTPLDMVLVPLAVSFAGSVVGLGLASVTTPALNWVSEHLAATMQVNPVLGAMVVSVAWFLFLMTPASSAALAIAVQLDPMSAGAALIGTTVGFVAFTAMSFNQNNIGANIAQTVVTPKVQFANILKRPVLAVGPAVIAMVMAAVAVVGFDFKVPFAIAGLGLNSLIAPLWLMAHNLDALGVLLLFGVVLPAALSWGYYRFLKTVGQTRQYDLRLQEL